MDRGKILGIILLLSVFFSLLSILISFNLEISELEDEKINSSSEEDLNSAQVGFEILEGDEAFDEGGKNEY